MGGRGKWEGDYNLKTGLAVDTDKPGPVSNCDQNWGIGNTKVIDPYFSYGLDF